MNRLKHMFLMIMIAMAPIYAASCALDEVAGAEEDAVVVYNNGAYGYYWPCDYDYSAQCWYPAPPEYVYGGFIGWGPRWHGYPGYRPIYRPGSGHGYHPGIRHPDGGYGFGGGPIYKRPPRYAPGYGGGWNRGGGRGGRR